MASRAVTAAPWREAMVKEAMAWMDEKGEGAGPTLEQYRGNAEQLVDRLLAVRLRTPTREGTGADTAKVVPISEPLVCDDCGDPMTLEQQRNSIWGLCASCENARLADTCAG